MTCSCCGDAKPWHAFSYNGKRRAYSPNCRDCGAWLFLFRQFFGESRDWEANRRKTAQRKRVTKRTRGTTFAVFNAWHGGL